MTSSARMFLRFRFSGFVGGSRLRRSMRHDAHIDRSPRRLLCSQLFSLSRYSLQFPIAFQIPIELLFKLGALVTLDQDEILVLGELAFQVFQLLGDVFGNFLAIALKLLDA